ncbi:hypothetical protein FD755_009567 [Muntiacus reevesi]|uniref:Transmembrane protein 117 n=1 Tax=Muntiacus reevesi TaxID=9886 RepID=A0A5N3XVH7_MUNRE|nr:hypothetical protein FD755_009567 [Muntiacus reevesi]
MGKDFRYYFQHPWSRMIVAYLVIFFNFLIFAEDPVSHSQTEANVIVVGNCFSFVTNKYPRGVGWRLLKVLLWLLAILIGLIAGKFLFHQRLFETRHRICFDNCDKWKQGLEFYLDDETKDVLCLNFSIIFDLFSFHPEIYSSFIHLELSLKVSLVCDLGPRHK